MEAVISEAFLASFNLAYAQPSLLLHRTHFAVPSVGRRPYPAKAEPKLLVSDGRSDDGRRADRPRTDGHAEGGDGGRPTDMFQDPIIARA